MGSAAVPTLGWHLPVPSCVGGDVVQGNIALSKQVKFVRLLNDQGQTYGSYTDYWRLVALSDFATCEQNEIQPDADETYILSPPNGNAHAIASQPRRAKMICWMLERPTGGLAGFVPQMYDQVWISDRWLASQFKDDPKVKYVPVGGHPSLGGTPQPVKLWNFSHMAYIYGRRQRIVNELEGKGYKVAGACWGAERDWRLASSKMGLCLHQDTLPIIEPLRHVLFACWKLPLVAEPSHDPFPYRVYGLDEIERATEWEGNYHLMTEHLTFRKCVEAAL